MVQIIEPQRRRIGIAGRRKRLSRHADDVYYTASTGHTILENNDEIVSATPRTSSGSTVTPSITKRRKKFGRDETLDRNEVAALLTVTIQEENQSKKSDSSVQVSIDDDECKLNEVHDIDSSLPGINTVTHNKFAMQQEERIESLMKQLQERDEQINKMIISHSNEQESIRSDFERKIESLQAKIVEMESKHCKEISDLKVDVANWKNKASNLSLDLERERRYKSSSHVYHGRFLLDNPPPSSSQKSVIPEFIHYSSSDSEVINGSQDCERNDGNVDTFDDNEPNGRNKQFFDSTTRSNALAMLNSKPIVLPRVIHKANSYGRDTTGSTTNERHGLNNNYQLMIFSSTDEN